MASSCCSCVIVFNAPLTRIFFPFNFVPRYTQTVSWATKPTLYVVNPTSVDRGGVKTNDNIPRKPTNQLTPHDDSCRHGILMGKPSFYIHPM